MEKRRGEKSALKRKKRGRIRRERHVDKQTSRQVTERVQSHEDERSGETKWNKIVKHLRAPFVRTETT